MVCADTEATMTASANSVRSMMEMRCRQCCFRDRRNIEGLEVEDFCLIRLIVEAEIGSSNRSIASRRRLTSSDPTPGCALDRALESVGMSISDIHLTFLPQTSSLSMQYLDLQAL